MTTSMYFSLVAMVFVAPHIGTKAAAIMWGLSVVASVIFWGKS